MRSGRMLVPLLVILLAAACTRAVDGTVRPARGLAPRPLTGQAVNAVLLDDGELADALGQQFTSKADSPPRFGGRERLYDVHSSPTECAGVVFQLQKRSYGSADVRAVAQETWWTADIRNAKVINVVESVVALPTVAAADAVFAAFSQQWNRCNGATVTSDFGIGYALTSAISDVRAANSVLAATVQTHNVTTLTSTHAVGVRANCVVEVEVAFFSDQRPGGAAVDLAHRMMGKISGLS
jgi:PknH-like extracellular domain